MLRVLEELERDCPLTAPRRSELGMQATRDRFEACAASMDKAAASTKQGYLRQTAEVISQSLRVMLWSAPM